MNDEDPKVEKWKRRVAKLDALISAADRYQKEFGSEIQKNDPVALELKRMTDLRHDKDKDGKYRVAKQFYYLCEYYKNRKQALEDLGTIYGRVYGSDLFLTFKKNKDRTIDQILDAGLPRFVELLNHGTTRWAIRQLAKEGYLKEKR